MNKGGVKINKAEPLESVFKTVLSDEASFGEGCEYRERWKETFRCALTGDMCHYARCPYNPRETITIEVGKEDGRLVKRKLHPDGSVSAEYYDDEEEKRRKEKLDEIAGALFRIEEMVGAGKRCASCGKPLTKEEILCSQGNHCLICWDRMVYEWEQRKDG